MLHALGSCSASAVLIEQLNTYAIIAVQDPHNLDEYLERNIFLPDINNEGEDKNADYADNLAALKRLVLFRFEDDTTGWYC